MSISLRDQGSVTDPRSIETELTTNGKLPIFVRIIRTSFNASQRPMDQGSVGLREVVFLPRRASSDLTTDPRSKYLHYVVATTLDQGSASSEDDARSMV